MNFTRIFFLWRPRYMYYLINAMRILKTKNKLMVRKSFKNAKAQISLEIDTIEASGKCINPVTLTPEGKVYYCQPEDWRSGFFPGSVWYLYELTKDTTLLPLAQKYTEALERAKTLTLSIMISDSSLIVAMVTDYV